MLNIKRLGKNKFELSVGTKLILVSYEIPVAAYAPAYGYVKLDKMPSSTSRKHANEWIGRNATQYVPEETIRRLVS